MRPSRLLVALVTRAELLRDVQVSEGLDDFDAARADLLALVGLLPDGPVAAQQLSAEVQPSWARLAARERELADVCRRCDVFYPGRYEHWSSSEWRPVVVKSALPSVSRLAGMPL